jgi:hypothetical protein
MNFQTRTVFSLVLNMRMHVYRNVPLLFLVITEEIKGTGAILAPLGATHKRWHNLSRG